MADRYSRQKAIEGFGSEGQQRLLNGHVAVIGCGALGSVVAMYLAGAGVGTITVADFDTVDISNLQRQVFFAETDAGKSKASLIAGKIRALNSEVTVNCIPKMITRKNGGEYLGDADFIIDATDNPASKYMTDRLCEDLGKPCCIGGVEGMRGQLITICPGDPRYRDLFPDLPDDPGLTPCSIAGVLGPAAGAVASLQAAEAIKYLTGVGPLLRHRLFDFDLHQNRFTLFDL